MNKTSKRILCFFLCVLVFAGTITVSASDFSQQETYTYSNDQIAIAAPASYEKAKSLRFDTLGLSSDAVITDIASYNSKIYILEKVSGTVTVLDSNYNPIGTFGKDAGINLPEGLFISDKGYIYVADTGNGRIVKFDLNGNIVRTIGAPDKEKTLSAVEYHPSKVVVDSGERIYTIVRDETGGIYQLDTNGNFLGFFGSVPVVPSLKELFWRTFSTKEQLSRMLLFVPTEYSNMDIDSTGFIYTTVATNTDSETAEYIKSGGADSTLAPIRRLNPKNIDVLVRNGSMPPAGDLIEKSSNKESGNASRFIDICVHDNGVYSALDSTHGRVFTYDSFGNLMYQFGNINDKRNGFKSPVAICENNNDILVADGGLATVSVWKPTDYAKLINSAIEAERVGNYTLAVETWNKVLKVHSGSGLAFMGIGREELRKGNYRLAMKWFKKADNMDYYSQALKKFRQEIGYTITGGVICFIVLAVIISYILKRKRSKSDTDKIKKNNPVANGFKYAFYIIRHPFDGFWDMQFENRGNIISATLVLIGVTVFNLISCFTTGYLVSGNQSSNINILLQGVLSVIVPFALWCVANWSVTSLMNGSGTAKNIYMYSCYSLTPLLISLPLLIIISNLVSLDELTLYTIIKMLFFIWTGFLLFAGTLVVHQYSASRTVLTIAIIIVAMGIIVFLLLLSTTVVQQMVDFLRMLIEEITLRL